MNRQQLQDLFFKAYEAGVKKEDLDLTELADFILTNFTPNEAEKITAEKIYLLFLKNRTHEGFEYSFIAKKAHEAAEAFNNYKPE